MAILLKPSAMLPVPNVLATDVIMSATTGDIWQISTAVEFADRLLSGALQTDQAVTTLNGSVVIGTGSFGGASGKLYNEGGGALIIYGHTGASYDLRFFNGIGSNVFEVPTGTTNVEFNGNIQAVDSIFTGNVSGVNGDFSGTVKPESGLGIGTSKIIEIVGTTLTITGSFIRVATTGNVPQTLNTILGGFDGQYLRIRPSTNAGILNLASSGGNLKLGFGRTDVPLNNASEGMSFIYDANLSGGSWIGVTTDVYA